MYFRRFSPTTALVTLCLSLFFLAGTCEGLVERTTENGKVIGQHYKHRGYESYRFLGIPYAKAPVGDRRFRPPQNAGNYPGGELEAFEFGPHCLQQSIAGMEGSEDCLYLNIWTPVGTEAGAKKPVMFFIHGGANEWGRADQTLESLVHAITLPFTGLSLATFLEPLDFPIVDVPIYDGQILAAEQDVVIVTINYRVGPLGHLAHPSLGEGSGNFTFLDIKKALEWVQSNIEAFGGNRDNVTLFGESAGAWNICGLMYMPSAEGLFDKAIMQSQSCHGRTVAQAEAAGNVIVDHAGCSGAGNVASCLRNAPAHSLVADEDLWGSGVPNKFIPTVDGDIFPEFFTDAVANGTFNDVPLIIGANKDEYIIVADTDDNFNCPMEGALDVFAGSYGSDIYKYRFEHNPVIPLVVPVFHAAELPYVFGSAGEMFLNSPYDTTVAGYMMEYWAAFAHTGDPNDAPLASWPAWNPTSQKYKRIKTILGTGSGSLIYNQNNCNNPFPDRIKYW